MHIPFNYTVLCCFPAKINRLMIQTTNSNNPTKIFLYYGC
uniref:Uncharacterized protein n=1 Tax=Arundo donax TaxID=35708 RepID=A0A0A9EWE6_ARUDO